MRMAARIELSRAERGQACDVGVVAQHAGAAAGARAHRVDGL